ncbi:hypothetical protein HCCG_00748 [Helicobacter cinaedi CCUG 18818 = ATCC BAA-847]|uniref:Uncharacterized protein n=1 Tax=Helicobacter cinaedi CCUG 18818 = ATCC BAA-847 TaxID=537971 RepID=A0ABN0B9R1_9HELI|nr:hypothetical protein HCCG_00748 [Helicobacter cinaedi CCUG 18818 = ATCC BAA-847]
MGKSFTRVSRRRKIFFDSNILDTSANASV